MKTLVWAQIFLSVFKEPKVFENRLVWTGPDNVKEKKLFITKNRVNKIFKIMYHCHNHCHKCRTLFQFVNERNTKLYIGDVSVSIRCSLYN